MKPTNFESMIGCKVFKKRVGNKAPKPFKSGEIFNTVTGIINHPYLNVPAFTFAEDDSYVQCRACRLEEDLISKNKESRVASAPSEIEYVFTDGKQHRLTITPTRVTVKIMAETTQEYQHYIQQFVKYVIEEMGEVAYSWRGHISFHNDAGVEIISTSLQTESRETKYFRHDLKD